MDQLGHSIDKSKSNFFCVICIYLPSYYGAILM